MELVPTYEIVTASNDTNGQNSSTCSKSIRMDLFVHYSLIPAVLITITLSYLQRQAKHEKTIENIPLGKRFGIVVPVNFISSYSNRWSYGAACGATATTVFLLFFNEYYNYFNFAAPTWAKALVYLLSALEVGMDYYPFFACLSTNHRLVGSTLGFCYSLCWFCVQLADICQCQRLSDTSIILVFTPVPSLVCCLFLVGRFLQLFTMTVLSYYRQMNSKDEEEPLLPQHLTNYVRRLLQPAPETNEQNPSQRWKIYAWDTHFKFPTRMIVTAVLCLICLYNFVLVDLFVSPKAVKGLDSWILGTVNLSYSSQTKGVLLQLRVAGKPFFSIFTACWFYSTFPSAFTSVIYVLHVLARYRKEMKKLYKGGSEIPSTGRPAVVLAASMRYTGNQIAYLLWGYFLLHIMFFLISLIITFWFVVPIKEGKGTLVLQIFGYTVLGIVIMVAVIVAQILAAQLLFLQDKISPEDKNKPLAINNRRGFQNFSYFFMFYSAILGFGACLVRVLFNVLLGSWLLARIDRPLFPKGFEGADMGYSTWTGMLQVDLHHTHPIVLTFCHILTQDVMSRKHHTGPDVLQDCRNKQRKTKWHLAYTLIKNPTLILYRKPNVCLSRPYPLSTPYDPLLQQLQPYRPMELVPTYEIVTASNDTNGQNSNTCSKSIRMDLFVHYSLIPAVLITIILSYLQRQAKHEKTIEKIPLGKRFGIVVPMNFISSYSNRWSYGAACGATATTVFLLFFNEYSYYFNFAAPTGTKALVYLLSALEVGMDYYPFFACLSTNHRLVGSTLGFCYSLCWSCVQLADICQCQRLSDTAIILVFTSVPSLVCCLFLVGRFLQLFTMTVLSYYRQMNSKDEEEPLLPQHLTNYVRRLLQPAPETNEQNPSQRWKIYAWDTHFKFPTRMMATAVLCLICLYNFVLVDLFFSTQAVKGLDSLILGTVNLSYSNQTKWVLLQLRDCWFYSTFPSACISVIYVLHVLARYRKEMKKLYKGGTEIPSTGRPAVVLASSIRYTGNQIAYLLWGYFLLHIMLFMISLIISFCFVVPIQEGKGMLLLQILGNTVLGIVIMVAVIIAQVSAAQFLFLQDKISPEDKDKPLAINNRRGFQNFSYFIMFYSAILGFGACLVRILLNLLLGSWFLARIDRPLFLKGYEGADMGYSTWNAMLQVDLHHTHPIVLTFCNILTQDVMSRKHHTGPDVLQDCRNKQRKTKWHLAYTLIKNPTLILYRKPNVCLSRPYPPSKDVLHRLLINTLQ